MPKAHVVFTELSRLIGTKPYFVADRPTLADILLAAHLDFLAQTPEWRQLTLTTPNLVSWLDRMTRRPSFTTTTWERVAELAKAA